MFHLWCDVNEGVKPPIMSLKIFFTCVDVWTKRLMRNKNQDLWKHVNKIKEQQLMKIKMDRKVCMRMCIHSCWKYK